MFEKATPRALCARAGIPLPAKAGSPLPSALMGGLARIGPTDSATISTLEPVVTLSLAVALLGETLAPVQVLGGACILAGVVRLARSNQVSAAPQQVRNPEMV